LFESLNLGVLLVELLVKALDGTSATPLSSTVAMETSSRQAVTGIVAEKETIHWKEFIIGMDKTVCWFLASILNTTPNHPPRQRDQ